MDMKRTTLLSLAVFLFLIGNMETMAQNPQKKTEGAVAGNEAEELLIYKFEPNYLTSVELRREEFKKAKESLDTMDISDRKRKKMLKDLLKNTPTKRLSKVMLTSNHYEDDQEN